MAKQLRKGSLLDESLEAKIAGIERNFNLSEDDCRTVMQRMTLEMSKGLGKETNEKAKVKMIPSFVTALPDGTERGNFLALDLGGTNFRVLHVQIIDPVDDDQPNIEMDSQIYKMPQSVITGEGEKLFDHIAECMADFLTRLGLSKTLLPVGFTFSFPCKQESLDSASLIAWTKGFSAPGVEGKNVVTMLKDAIDRRGDMQCNVVAVVNDTVGTLMSCAHSVPDCQIGLIVGTGSNACYMEQSKNVELISSNVGDMCINMEWGAFGDDGALEDFRNTYDRLVDDASINAGRQLFEKMISGMYLGEIVRLVLCNLTEQGALFNGRKSPALSTYGKFETSFVSQIEGLPINSVLSSIVQELDEIQDTGPVNEEINTKLKLISRQLQLLSHRTSDMTATQNVLASLDLLEANRADCEIVTRVCQAVSRRAAYMCASGIAAVAHKIAANDRASGSVKEGETARITAGVDGTVYKKHPTFADMMDSMTKSLCKDADIEVDFALSYDGSGKGAALVTAVADRLLKAQ